MNKLFRQQGFLSKTIAHFMKKLYTCWPTMIVERKGLNKQVDIFPYSVTHRCYKFYFFSFCEKYFTSGLCSAKTYQDMQENNMSKHARKRQKSKVLSSHHKIYFHQIQRDQKKVNISGFITDKKGGWDGYTILHRILNILFLSFCLGVSFQEKITIIFQDQFLRITPI